MVRLLAFDIDNTLAAINKPIEESTIRRLRRFEEEGLKIAFISGKPAIYIAGMVRQLGLEKPLIIGENGLSIYYSSTVPPIRVIESDVTQQLKERLMDIKYELTAAFDDKIWFQPNAVSVTAFPLEGAIMPELVNNVKKIFEDNYTKDSLVYYLHSDSIDIAPKHIHKGMALERLLKTEGWGTHDVIAVGDGDNDIPMFKTAGHTIGINYLGEFQVNRNFQNIEEALIYIQEFVFE